MAKFEPAPIRPLFAMMFAAFAAYIVLDLLYFFAAPLILTVAIAVCLAIAWYGTRTTSRECDRRR